MIDFHHLSVNDFVDAIRNRDKVILSRAITLLESQVDEHREKGLRILEELMQQSSTSLRIGISGPPGVGKSTFIEAIGKKIDESNRKLAIVAIDQTSKKNKGSILGDKTRMQELSKRDEVFIRPSASGNFTGGVSMHTREVIRLLECAGYDTILVETVGVGQGETAVADLVDVFLLLTMAGAGDELQGIKRGIMELADIVVINKDDGDNKSRVRITKAELKRALELFPPPDSGFDPVVESCSSLSGEGIDKILEIIYSFNNISVSSGYFNERRKSQLKTWLHEIVQSEFMRKLIQHPEIQSSLTRAEEQIEQKGNFSPLEIYKLVAGMR